MLTRAALVSVYSMVMAHVSLLGKMAVVLNPGLFSEKEINFLNEKDYQWSDEGELVLDTAKQTFKVRATVAMTLIAKKVSHFTGLSEDYLIKADLRVNLPQFMVELQRSRHLSTGRLDARFSGPAPDLLAEYADYDPQSTAVEGAFVAAFNGYVREDLKFGKDLTYNTSSGDANRAWDWKRAGDGRSYGFPGSPNVEQDLVEAMVTNPNLHIEVENGLYDLATPFLATEYTMNHLELPENLQKNIKLQYYDAGHMMYLHEEDLAKLKANVGSFLDNATKQ